MGLQGITTNLRIGRVRTEVVNGREYKVAPATIIVPGVLNGSKGALYYPVEEVTAKPGVWNNVLVTHYHPFNPVNGSPLAANSPGVKSRQGIGITKNDRVENGKRVVDVWFDSERTKDVAPEVYNALLANKVIGLSTGLYTDDHPAPVGSQDRKGRPYTLVARNYRPDHLAILPDQKGACAIEDGCGVLLNKYNFSAEDCPKCGVSMEGDPDSGKCNSCGHMWGTPVENEEHPMSFWHKLGELIGLAANAQPRHQNTGQYLNSTHKPGMKQTTKSAQKGYAETGVKSDTDDGRGKATITQQGSTGLAGDAEDEPQSEYLNPAENECDTQKMNEEGSGFESDEQRQAFFGLKAGGGGSGGGSGGGGSKEADSKSSAADDKSKSANKGSRASGHKAAADMHKEAASAHEKAGNKDKAEYHKSKVAHHEAKAKTATRNEVSNMTRNQKLAVLTMNCKCEKDKTVYNGLSDEEVDNLFLMKVNAAAPPAAAVPPKTPAAAPVQAGGEEEDAAVKEDTETVSAAPSKAPVPVGNLKMDEATLNYLVSIERSERSRLATALVRNVADPKERKAVFDKYVKLPVPELQSLIKLMGPVAPVSNNVRRQRVDDPRPMYLGQGVPPYVHVQNEEKVTQNQDSEDILDVPTLNFEQAQYDRNKARQVS